MQANNNSLSGEFSDLRNYVMSRLMWKPGLDSWHLATEFCRLHYKRAARPIIDHLTLIHAGAEKAGHHPGCFPKPDEVGLTPEICRQSRACFQRALALADDDDVRARVEKASICAYRAQFEVGGKWETTDGRRRLILPPELVDLVPEYIRLCKRYQMTMTAEYMKAEKYFEQIRPVAAESP
jgi:hypothetical protein